MAPGAVLLYEDKRILDGGFIVQGRIWALPRPVPGSRHRFKYSLFFGRPGERIVGYDNERPKGDHRHYGEREEPYAFSDMEALLSDFLADVARELARTEGREPHGG